MQFHVQLIDDPAQSEKRKTHIEAHWSYFDDHRDNFIARGATATDDLARTISSVIFVEFETWDAVRSFLDNEPFNRAGLYGDIHVRRWSNALKRRQTDFPRQDGQVYWYVRGYGRRGSNVRREEIVEEQRKFLAPYDDSVIVQRGPVLDDDGKEWQGSANLICMPSRDELAAFMAEWPYCRNDLYESVLIERYRFGGRPGQVV